MAKAVRASIILLAMSLTTAAFADVEAEDDLIVGLEDTVIAGELFNNDDGQGDPYIVTGNSTPSVGSVTVSSGGTIAYTPPMDWSGEDNFTYTVQSQSSDCLMTPSDPDCSDTANVTIYVLAVVDMPDIIVTTPTGDEDTTIALGIGITLYDDADGSQNMFASVSNVPAGATLSAGTDLGGGDWDVAVSDLPGLAMTPPPDVNGPILLVVGITAIDVAVDNSFNVINADVDFTSAGFFVIVNPVNDPPFQVTAPPGIITDEDVPASVDLAGVWDDVDIYTNGQGLTYSVVSINNTAVGTAVFNGSQLDIIPIPEMSDPSGTIRVAVTDGLSPPLEADVSVQVNSVNDDPIQIGFVTPVSVDEDSPPVIVDFAGVFDDVDILTEGDSLTYTTTIAGSVVQSAVFSGEQLTLTFPPDVFGSGSVFVRATDSRGASAVPDYELPIGVNSINDAPFIAGSLPDITMDEDDPPRTISLMGVFDDVDIPTGDVLYYQVSSNNPGLFTSLTVTGVSSAADLIITLAPDANGVADITLVAEDASLATSPPLTFNLDVTGVDDFPAPQPDSYTLYEDDTEMMFDVLANDYLAETPTLIVTLGATDQHSYIDGNGDTITQNNGVIRIDPTNQIVYEPAANFWGTDTFDYTIRDADGDEETATVTVTVNQLNDPPTGTALRTWSIYEGNTLAINAVNGLFLGAYDIDGQMLDSMGNPVGSTISLQIATFPDPTEGNLTVDVVDGSFVFVPTGGFTGTATFTYQLFDNDDFSPVYSVEIDVITPPAAPSPPTAGEVAVTWNLANTPLEQSATVAPNVMVMMDDSGSMDWHLSIQGVDEQGRMELTNSAIATSSERTRDFTYLYDLSVNSYDWDSGNGRRLPSEESLPANNQHGVWRARNSSFNRIYYNPQITYEPWVGQDSGNNDFANAVPIAVRLDPVSPGNTIDITTRVSYTAHEVPDWDTDGGTTNVNVTGYLIPRYYTSTDAAPLAWNSQRTLVEIEAGNAPFIPGVRRDDCADGDPDECTYQQELQNFANWFQYYRSRELVAKGSLGTVVSQLQDVRVGYETLNNRVDEAIADMNEYYWEGEKKELLDDIYSVDSYSGTPLRSALDRAGDILGCNFSGRTCPALAEPEGICQQNFTLLFSDGYWNGDPTLTGNHDGDDGSTFDGGKYADTFDSTLADVAMFHYENDMFTGVENSVPLSARDIAGVPTGTFGSSSQTLHQHMKTFTIAFGVTGVIDAATAEAENPSNTIAWTDPDDGGSAKIDDMVHAAVNGRGSYLSAGDPEELRGAFENAFLEFTQAASSTSAAAFNSTSLRQETLLYRGFYDLQTKTGELTATAVLAGGTLAPTTTWTAAELLDETHANGLAWTERTIVTYDRYTGNGKPFRYSDLNTDQTATVNSAQVAYLRGDDTNEQPNGSLRDRPDTEGNLGPIVNSSPVFVGRPRSFNRDQAPYPTTDLYSNFVSTNYTRQAIVYVGVNDGMVHGFDAATGVEQFAFVPNPLIDSTDRYSNKLSAFTSPFYLHDYYVDMTPRVRDIYGTSVTSGSKHWMTVIVSGLGAGGKGYYALDVTDPTIFGTETDAEDAVLWEFTHEDDHYPLDDLGNPLGGAVGAITDPDNMPVKDLGYGLSVPSIVMSNVSDGTAADDKKWIAVFGNGPNSTAGIAKLFVLFIDEGIDGVWDADDFVKLDTGYGVPLPGEPLEGFPNGLGTPTMVDQDNDGTVELGYAGDRLGNLFRFDLSDPDPDNWTVTRIFTASYDDSGTQIIQPILHRPLVVKNPDQPGYVVIFGTGSFMTEEDGSNQDIQSIYGIWDPLDGTPITAQANTKSTRLVEQTMTNVVDDSVTPQQTRRILTANAVEYEAEAVGLTGTYGWYIDLDMERASNTLSGSSNPDISGNPPPAAQFPGERAIRRFLFRDGAVITTTVLPATNANSCLGVRPGAILVFSAMSGGDIGTAIIDFNTDGEVDENDLVTVGGEEKSGGLLFDHSDLDGSLVDLSTLGGAGDTDYLVVSGGNDTIFFEIDDLNDNKTGRLSWSQVEMD